MVIRVVFAAALASIALPASAAPKAFDLPYDIADFFRTPSYRPQIAYDVDGLIFDRVPDHVSLGYRVQGLNGDYVRPFRRVRDVGPLPYDFENLVLAPDFGMPITAAAAP